MFPLPLVRWFTRPTVCVDPSDGPRIVAPAVPAPSRRVTPADRGVEVDVSQTSDEMVVRVKGDATVDSAGALLNGLLVHSAQRRVSVTLDLSELRSISSLALGVLVTYGRSVIRRGGQVRLADEVQPAVKEALAQAEFLAKFETTEHAAPAGL
jgi:anti-anti-sigma factor